MVVLAGVSAGAASVLATDAVIGAAAVFETSPKGSSKKASYGMPRLLFLPPPLDADFESPASPSSFRAVVFDLDEVFGAAADFSPLEVVSALPPQPIAQTNAIKTIDIPDP